MGTAPRLLYIQDNTSRQQLHGMVQQATNGPEQSVSNLERAQTRSASCETVLFG